MLEEATKEAQECGHASDAVGSQWPKHWAYELTDNDIALVAVAETIFVFLQQATGISRDVIDCVLHERVKEFEQLDHPQVPKIFEAIRLMIMRPQVQKALEAQRKLSNEPPAGTA